MCTLVPAKSYTPVTPMWPTNFPKFVPQNRSSPIMMKSEI